MRRLRIWALATRPKTLLACICPVAVGTFMAAQENHFHLTTAIFTFLGAIFIQVGTNFANDYFDFIKGAATHTRLGPTRATQAGLVSPQSMKAAFCITFFLAFLSGIYLMVRGGWPIIAIGICSIISGIL